MFNSWGGLKNFARGLLISYRLGSPNKTGYISELGMVEGF
jgi:hypothetical protein